MKYFNARRTLFSFCFNFINKPVGKFSPYPSTNDDLHIERRELEENLYKVGPLSTLTVMKRIYKLLLNNKKQFNCFIWKVDSALVV